MNGLDETLRYLTVTGGKPGKSEIIDDGSTVDGKPFADGKHVVGDDSAIHAEGDVITVYYQDATVGTLRRAAGTASGSTHKWDLRTLAAAEQVRRVLPADRPRRGQGRELLGADRPRAEEPHRRRDDPGSLKS